MALTANYTNGRFDSLARSPTTASSVRPSPQSFTDAESYGAKTLFDAEVGYRFNQVNLSVGGRNVFNTYPDQMRNPNNNNGNTFHGPPRLHSAITGGTSTLGWRPP